MERSLSSWRVELDFPRVVPSIFNLGRTTRCYHSEPPLVGAAVDNSLERQS